MTGTYPCPSCTRDTSHTVLAAVNSRDYDNDGLAFFLNHYLTVKCNGCGTISFCHISKCSEEENHDAQGRPYLIPHKKHYPEAPKIATQGTVAFIEPARLKELSGLPTNQYDTARLAQMLDELDRAYRTSGFISCILLIRAVLDHVPPIFGQRSFAEVANNYAGGGRSFRDSMLHLENSSRKIADAHLHSQIRNKETVPTRTQVEFRADIDVLIGEVIRILRSKP